MEFLIQTIDGEVKHDFSFELIAALGYQNWLSQTEDYKYRLTEEEMPEGLIPVGTVEFVMEYIEKHFEKRPRPLNIPDELMEEDFLKRKVLKGTKDIKKEIPGKAFMKSMDAIKSFKDIVENKHLDLVPDGNYMVSEMIEIKSEYRAFVYKGNLVGLQNYGGDFTVFPDVKIINRMIQKYQSQPIALTIDVAITDKGDTVIVEAHDFFSCGLYGFSDYRIYPFMLSNWFKQYTQS